MRTNRMCPGRGGGRIAPGQALQQIDHVVAAEHGAERGLAAGQGLADGGIVVLEHVVQQEHRPLQGRQPLQGQQEGHRHILGPLHGIISTRQLRRQLRVT